MSCETMLIICLIAWGVTVLLLWYLWSELQDARARAVRMRAEFEARRMKTKNDIREKGKKLSVKALDDLLDRNFADL